MTCDCHTYRVLRLEAFVSDAGVSAKPEEHGGACGTLRCWSGVATESGDGVGVGCGAIAQLQVVVRTAEKHEKRRKTSQLHGRQRENSMLEF